MIVFLLTLVTLTAAQSNPLTDCCLINRRLIDRLDDKVANVEDEDRKLRLAIGNVRSR